MENPVVVAAKEVDFLEAHIEGGVEGHDGGGLGMRERTGEIDAVGFELFRRAAEVHEKRRTFLKKAGGRVALEVFGSEEHGGVGGGAGVGLLEPVLPALLGDGWG